MVRLVVADRLQIIREGVKALLTGDSGIRLAGEAADTSTITRILAREAADVLLMGIDSPDADIKASVHCLKERFPQLKVLLFTMPESEYNLLQLLEAGASGCLFKQTDREELLFAIHTVSKGTPYICTRAILHLLQKSKRNPVSCTYSMFSNPDNLSKRELEVLHWIAQGYTNAQIADKLFTSKRTVETHRQHLLEKTSSNNTAMLMKYAISSGLVH